MNSRLLIRMAPFAAGGMLLAAGCAPAVRPVELKMIDAERAYEAGNYATAAAAVDQYLGSNPPVEDRAAALYLRSLVHVRSGRRSQAEADARAAAELTRLSDTRWRAYFALGTLHFEDGEWSKALRAYEAALRDGPAQPPLDAAHFRTGQCLERLNRWPESWSRFEDVARRHPRSELAEAARRRAALRARHFAIQCGVFSQRQNAESLMAALRQARQAPYVQPERRGGRQMHVVLAGRFARYEEAQRALREVARVVNQPVIWP
jgi:tetratricopeptide (TPR) repeat protein